MAKKTVTQDEVLEGADTEPRVYELGFHLDPELPQEEVKSAYQTIHDRIAKVGTIVAEGEPVKIPLAYRISRMETTGRRDFNSAFFCWIAYEADTSGHAEIDQMAKEEPRIVRYLDIRTTVDEAKHSAEMQEMFAQMASAPIEGEDPAEAPEIIEQQVEAAAPVAEEAA